MGKTEVECCDVTCIHNENVKLALEQMPDEELLVWLIFIKHLQMEQE